MALKSIFAIIISCLLLTGCSPVKNDKENKEVVPVKKTIPKRVNAFVGDFHDDSIRLIKSKFEHFFVKYQDKKSTKPFLSYHGTLYYKDYIFCDSAYISKVLYRKNVLSININHCSNMISDKDLFKLKINNDTLYINEMHVDCRKSRVQGRHLNIFKIINVPQFPKYLVFTNFFGYIQAGYAKLDTSSSMINLIPID
jgi:hypothetical protein